MILITSRNDKNSIKSTQLKCRPCGPYRRPQGKLRARSIRPKFPEIPIKWNRKFPEIRFENLGPPLGVVLSSGYLEILEISCSAPIPLVVKSYKMVASLACRHYTGCRMILLQFELVLDRLFSTKTLRSDFLENCELVVPNFLWVSSSGLHALPGEKFVSFSHRTCLARSFRQI